MNAAKVLEDLKRRFPNEPEYHQAVEEVLGTIEEEYNKHPEFWVTVYSTTMLSVLTKVVSVSTLQ